MTKAELKKLRAATDNAIGVIGAGSKPDGAINWGDLSCRQAAWVKPDSGKGYAEVLIEEAASDALDFQRMIRAELVKLGWPNVSVVTAW